MVATQPTRLTLALSLVWCGVATATTWHVNVTGTGDAPTIQAAINAAGPGDDVLVDPGAYTWTNQGGDSTGFWGPTLLVMRSDITLHSSDGPVATILDAEGHGRVFVFSAVHNTVVDGFTIRNGDAIDPNEIPQPDFQGQGGAVLMRGLSTPTIQYCIITDNQAEHEGGGFWILDSSPSLLFNVIARNRAFSTAGIRVAGSAANPMIHNNTIVGNVGTAIVVFSASATISHNIIAEHVPSPVAPGTGNGLACYFANVTVTHNNIWMNAQPDVDCTDPGGMSEDPLFCITGAEYELQPDSPCLPENNTCGALIGARSVGCTTTDVGDGRPPPGGAWIAASPNPFNPQTTITYALHQDAERVQLTVFDLRGHRIARLVDAQQSGPSHSVVWNGRDDQGQVVGAGVYVARLRIGQDVSSTKLTLVK